MDSIDKKIKELYSQFGGPPVYSKNKHAEKLCLFISRWYYRLTSGLYIKIKYFFQRLFRGYDDLDTWNAAWYIARKAIPVLTAMRNKFHGTSIKWHREDRHGNIIELTKDEVFADNDIPPAFTEDEWRAILDDIIYAFKFILDEDDEEIYKNYSQKRYEANRKRHKRGLRLFSIYFNNLWD